MKRVPMNVNMRKIMEFYHASKDVLPIGKELKSKSILRYYEEATVVLDSKRPKGAPAKKTSLFSSDSLEFALYFLLKQNIHKKAIKLYKVELKNQWKAVFSITHIIQRRLEKGKNIDLLIKEYWEPTRNWKFYEYLSPSFIVIEQMNHPILDEIEMKFKSMHDHNLADQFD